MRDDDRREGHAWERQGPMRVFTLALPPQDCGADERDLDLWQLEDLPIGVFAFDCPQCGLPMTLDAHVHKMLVHAGGAVTITPELVCPWECGWFLAATREVPGGADGGHRA